MASDPGLGKPGPPSRLTPTQAAYCDLFVTWFRSTDSEREDIDQVLRLLGRRVVAEARREAEGRSGGDRPLP